MSDNKRQPTLDFQMARSLALFGDAVASCVDVVTVIYFVVNDAAQHSFLRIETICAVFYELVCRDCSHAR